MQLDRRQVKFKQAYVLLEQGVGAGLDQLPGRFEFIILEQGVERHQDAALKR